MTQEALIFGAGKIGRGFIAHLLSVSGYKLTFVEPSEEVVGLLRDPAGYPLHVLGVPEKNTTIRNVAAIALDDTDAVHEAAARHTLIFTAAGGANLPTIGKLLGPGLLRRFRTEPNSDVNIIICENYKNPANILRQAIVNAADDEAFTAWTKEHLGIAETQVLRSCIEPTPELRAQHPLSLQVQDWWILPCDAEAIRGTPPRFEGLALKPNFQNELVRKVYTYNCSNATISYLGWMRGYEMLYEGANDPQILAVTQQVYDESGDALIKEYGFDPAEQKALQDLAISKYQDKRILDPIERNGRDSFRKLSPTDRLLGPANLAVKHGVTPKALALAVAAGLHYAGSDDPGTVKVQKILRSEGLVAAIKQVCQLEPTSVMGSLIIAAVDELDQFNQRGVALVRA